MICLYFFDFERTTPLVCEPRFFEKVAFPEHIEVGTGKQQVLLGKVLLQALVTCFLVSKDVFHNMEHILHLASDAGLSVFHIVAPEDCRTVFPSVLPVWFFGIHSEIDL